MSSFEAIDDAPSMRKNVERTFTPEDAIGEVGCDGRKERMEGEELTKARCVRSDQLTGYRSCGSRRVLLWAMRSCFLRWSEKISKLIPESCD